MITIQDVANHTNLSTATVSKVVNRRPDVGADTVAMVEEAIAALNYQPRRPGRPSGRRGKAANVRRSNRIALLVPGIPRSQINSPVYMDVLHGVEAAVRAADKSFVLSHLEPGRPCPKPLFSQKVDGVILFGPVSDKRLVSRLRSVPCVQVMGRIEREGGWDQVSYDNSRLGEIAAAYLLERGHRRVAFLSSNDKAPHLVERGTVFGEAVRAAGGMCTELIDNSLLVDTGSIQQVNRECLSQLIDRLFEDQSSGHGQPPDGKDIPSLPSGNTCSPTAVFLVADILAPAVHGELQRRGVVPEHDIDIISCNNERMILSHLHPRPAIIDIHAERVGQKAVEQLLWRMEHPGAPRATIALEPTLVQGEREFTDGHTPPVPPAERDFAAI